MIDAPFSIPDGMDPHLGRRIWHRSSPTNRARIGTIAPGGWGRRTEVDAPGPRPRAGGFPALHKVDFGSRRDGPRHGASGGAILDAAWARRTGVGRRKTIPAAASPAADRHRPSADDRYHHGVRVLARRPAHRRRGHQCPESAGRDLRRADRPAGQADRRAGKSEGQCRISRVLAGRHEIALGGTRR